MPQAPDELPVDQIYELRLVAGERADRDAPPDLLVEVPHGATARRHFERIRRRLKGALPDALEEFFFVNTDVGAPECAARLARWITRPTDASRVRELIGSSATAALEAGRRARVLVLRSLVPRTFADCNRLRGPAATAAGFTPAIPDYVRDSGDVAWLERLHAAYQRAADRAYAQVCGAGGLALQLHTYAPRSVRVERLDDGIVAALRRAYEPAVYESWERRPDADLITHATDGTRLAPADLVAALRERLGRVGVTATADATYRLDPATTGYRHAAAYRGRVLCLEINRELLADPFAPFREMRIGARKVARVVRPIAAVLLEALAARPAAER